jgi:outer membrane lipoprotein-sorting protein
MKRLIRVFASAALFCSVGLLPGLAADTNTVLAGWFAAQTNLHTWTADAIQTRSIKTFSQPLVSTGKVWVAVPDHFRWELGQPAQTVALRQPKELMLLYPRLKRAEKYPLDSSAPGPFRDALALLEASFPRSRAELESHFRVVSVVQSNPIVHLTLQPRSGLAKKFMAELEISFRADDFSPTSTELRFSDGSSMRNDFVHSLINPALPEGIFDAKLPPDFKVVEPLKK